MRIALAPERRNARWACVIISGFSLIGFADQSGDEISWWNTFSRVVPFGYVDSIGIEVFESS